MGQFLAAIPSVLSEVTNVGGETNAAQTQHGTIDEATAPRSNSSDESSIKEDSASISDQGATEAGQLPSDPIDIAGSIDPDAPLPVGSDDPIRRWCTGLPPKRTYLPVSPVRSSIRLSRRSTLSHNPELDHQLRTAMEAYKGKSFLRLSVRTLHRLSPLWKGEKPLADFTIFERIIIDKDINNVQADHVVAAMERVGAHCKVLVIIAPIKTSEFGDVFNREAGNINTSNDWKKIMSYFSNVKAVVFEIPSEQPNALTRDTYKNFSRAIAEAKFTQRPTIRIWVPKPAVPDLNLDYVNAALLKWMAATSSSSPASSSSSAYSSSSSEVSDMEM
ncbi:hypothetical protein CC80DRAFT_541581 [Byssothecium circinans]|uniref:Uncharacterized protein n=1 Tax=Byssothecium circinans TaxID=147558 RepID=A0A6A5UGB0_9PLEO|nr:hypothetical protein CC80DRAFT_541581 [Byssothecium circinans]